MKTPQLLATLLLSLLLTYYFFFFFYPASLDNIGWWATIFPCATIIIALSSFLVNRFLNAKQPAIMPHRQYQLAGDDDGEESLAYEPHVKYARPLAREDVRRYHLKERERWLKYVVTMLGLAVTILLLLKWIVGTADFIELDPNDGIQSVGENFQADKTILLGRSRLDPNQIFVLLSLSTSLLLYFLITRVMQTKPREFIEQIKIFPLVTPAFCVGTPFFGNDAMTYIELSTSQKGLVILCSIVCAGLFGFAMMLYFVGNSANTSTGNDKRIKRTKKIRKALYWSSLVLILIGLAVIQYMVYTVVYHVYDSYRV